MAAWRIAADRWSIAGVRPRDFYSHDRGRGPNGAIETVQRTSGVQWAGIRGRCQCQPWVLCNESASDSHCHTYASGIGAGSPDSAGSHRHDRHADACIYLEWRLGSGQL